MLAAKKKEIGAQWIVFDGIDVLLTLLQDPVRRNAGNLPPARLARGQRIDCDHHGQGRRIARPRPLHYGFLQFMVDCVVRLERRQEDRVSAQSIQITKYRGSGYAAAEFPLSFGPSGIEVGADRTRGDRASRRRASGSPRALSVWTPCSAAAYFAAAAR